MKYSMLYFKASRHLNDFDEVILQYDHETLNIIPYVQDHYKQEQRIILDVQQLPVSDFENSLEIFAAVAQKHPNIALMGTPTQLPQLKKANMKYFFSNVVDSWDRLHGYIKMGVSDVYIGDEFGFQLENISTVCKDNNVTIRVFANVAQSSFSGMLGSITNFFIRPEDVATYERLVDVIEFYGGVDRQDVLYEIYSQQSWTGNLTEIIDGLKEDVHNSLIGSIFGLARTSCRKRCSYSTDCNLCSRYVSIQNTIQGGIVNEH